MFLQVLVRQARELVLVVVHVVEEVDGVAEGAAGLDRLVRAGLRAQAAVHADAEVDLVAHLGQRAVRPRLRRDEDAAVRAGLGAGAAAGAALVEPEQAVRARAGKLRTSSGNCTVIGGLKKCRRVTRRPLSRPVPYIVIPLTRILRADVPKR